MARALTARAVEATKPDPAKRLEIPDGGLGGLYLVIQPGGAKSWAVRYRAGGKPRKLTLGNHPRLGLAEARSAAREALRAASEGGDPAGEKQAARAAAKTAPKDGEPDPATFKALVADFIRRHASKNRSAAQTERIMRVEVLPAWGDRRSDSITRGEVIELLDRIVDRGAPTMANRTLAAVRKAFNWAVARGALATSPCQGVKMPTEETARDRTLTDDELRWLWAATGRMGAPFGPLFRVMLIAGQREGEVAGMAEAEIDGATWTLAPERTKNGRRHIVHMAEAALAEIARVPRIKGEMRYIFTTTGEAPVSGWGRAKQRLDTLMLAEARREAGEAGRDAAAVTIPAWRLHDLRRTAASGMARAGARIEVVEKVLNHVSGSFAGVAGVYQRHEYRDEGRAALEAWASLLMRIVGVKPAGAVILMRGAR
jgi:integrase